MLKDNEVRIIELGEINHNSNVHMQKQNILFKKFESNFNQLQEDVEEEYKDDKQKIRKLDDVLLKLNKLKVNLENKIFFTQEPDARLKIAVIKKAVAMVKTRAVLIQNSTLLNKMADYELELDELRQKVSVSILHYYKFRLKTVKKLKISNLRSPT
jgi:hypothetical protein